MDEKQGELTGSPDTALSTFERLFCLEWLVDQNGTKAVIRAGKKQKPAAAAVTATRLLKKANVKAFLDDRTKERAARLGLDADYVVGRLHELEHFDLRTLYNDEGDLLPINKWPEGAGRVVQGLDVTVEPQYDLLKRDDKGEPVLATTKKLKLPGRIEALVAMGRHFGAFNDKLRLTGSMKLEDIVAGDPSGPIA